jgi:hypothetical protein
MKAFLTAAAFVSFFTLVRATAYSAQEPRFRFTDPAPSWESCEEMHDFYVARFESTPGFGLSRMAQPPMLDRSGTLDAGRRQYKIETLELVGLMQRETPVVYVPWNHGFKIDDTTFKNRSLTAFETESLASLRAGKDMASAGDGKDGALACVGALRAKSTCLQCHRSKKPGDLLGAFTYSLRPAVRRP